MALPCRTKQACCAGLATPATMGRIALDVDASHTASLRPSHALQHALPRNTALFSCARTPAGPTIQPIPLQIHTKPTTKLLRRWTTILALPLGTFLRRSAGFSATSAVFHMTLWIDTGLAAHQPPCGAITSTDTLQTSLACWTDLPAFSAVTSILGQLYTRTRTFRKVTRASQFADSRNA